MARFSRVRLPLTRRSRVLLAAGTACVALAIALAAVLASRGRRAPESPWTEARLARLTLRQKAAQMVVARAPAVPLLEAGTDSATVRLHRWARLGLGGVELTGGDAAAAVAMAAELRRGAVLPGLVLARLDRGVGVRFPAGTELPPPAALAVAGDEALAAEVAEVLAAEARAAGLDLVLLPGPPLPGPDGGDAPPPAAPAALGAYLSALRAGGVLAGLSAFRPVVSPGDTALPAVRWDRAALEVAQLEPLRAAVGAGAAALEPGYAAVPALTGDAWPLPFSGVAVQGLLRRDLGFGGLVVADADSAGPLARRHGAVPGVVAAIATGADLVLGAAHPEAMVDSIVAAVESGRIPPARIDHAVRRIFAAKERAGVGMPPRAPGDTARPPLRAPEALATAARAFERTAVVHGEPRRALTACRKVVLVTDPAADVRTFSGELARRIPRLQHLTTHAVARRGPLSRVADFPGNDADCVVVARFPGSRIPVVNRVVPALRDTTRRDTARSTPRPPPARSTGRPTTGSRSAGSRGTTPARQPARPAPPPPPPDPRIVRDTTARRIVHVTFAPNPGEAPPAEAAAAVVVHGLGAVAQRAAARVLFGEVERAGDEAARPRTAWPPARRLARAPAREAGMSADSLAKIDAAMREALDKGVFTGAVVAVGRRGRLVKMTGYGRTGGRAVDPETTRFDIASLTKVAATTPAIMALVEDGRVGLDAPVRRYVPQFRGSGKGDVTIRHLLTHTSGLPAGANLYGLTANPEEALRAVLRASLGAKPGERVVYSDFGMILLAEVVRRRGGEDPDRFLARRVFLPLGMEDTGYEPPLYWLDATVPTAQRSERERPYELDGVVHDGNAFRLGGTTGHAGLFSTAADLAVYAQALLNGGAYGGARLWQPATVRSFTAKQANAGTRALGWDTPAARSSAGGYFSARSYGHTGYTGTSLWIDPERGMFVILLTNRTYGEGTQAQILALRRVVANAAARAITDATVGPRPGTPEAQAEAARARARPKKPTRPSRPRPRPTRRPRRGDD